MVRMEFHEKDSVTTLRIEGRFGGRFAEDARSLIATKKIAGKLLVDLSELTWADSVGEEVLSWLGRIGCKFLAGNAYSLFVCENLGLPLFRVTRKRLVAGD